MGVSDSLNSVMSVSSLNEKIKSLLEAHFQRISVEGEISSVTYHSSGHIYFSIKDDKSTLKCVMWRSNTARLKFRLERGEHIVVSGNISVYTPRGEYQMIATSIEPYGKGALALAFEQLKKKLSAKGYFDSAHKKPVPKYPKKIAIVTAYGGAALQDMLNIASRRWPLVSIYVFDTAVQGEGASFEIADAIRRADRYGADVIIAGRGGGSVEDLWAFNEEAVADAIFEAVTPVVSAVGHEVDTLISDFVADLRAPTPSAAMEMILPDADEILYTLDELFESMKRRITDIIHNKADRAKSLEISMKNYSAENRLRLLYESFASVGYKMDETMRYRLIRLESEIEPIRERLQNGINRVIREKEDRVKTLFNTFEMNNPSKKVKEGWGEVVKDSRRVPLSAISVGEEFDINDGKTIVRAKAVDKISVSM